MSVEQADVVDAIGMKEEFVILTISDYLDWGDEAGHALALQAKLNAYLSFIESGELLKVYPQAVGKSLAIDVVMRVAPTSHAGRH